MTVFCTYPQPTPCCLNDLRKSNQSGYSRMTPKGAGHTCEQWLKHFDHFDDFNWRGDDAKKFK